MYVCMYVCMFLCIYLCIYVSLSDCLLACLFVCLFVCMFVYLFIHFFEPTNQGRCQEPHNPSCTVSCLHVYAMLVWMCVCIRAYVGMQLYVCLCVCVCACLCCFAVVTSLLPWCCCLSCSQNTGLCGYNLEADACCPDTHTPMNMCRTRTHPFLSDLGSGATFVDFSLELSGPSTKSSRQSKGGTKMLSELRGSRRRQACS